MMKGKYQIVNMLILVFLIISLNRTLLAQAHDITESENKAKTYFQNREFRNALNGYTRLFELYSQNPGYQYYIGRCLLELDENRAEAINNLRFAAVKGHNPDAWFYLGMAYHKDTQYDKAISSYKRFIDEGKRSQVRKLSARKMLEKAEKKQSDYLNRKIYSEDKQHVLSQKSQSNTAAGSYPDNSSSPAQIESSKQTKNEQPEDKSDITEHTITGEKASDNYISFENEELIEALRFQLVADSMNRLAKTKRADLKEIEAGENRNKLIGEITMLEKESKNSQTEADKYYMLMQKNPVNKQIEDTFTVADSLVELKEEVNGIKVFRYKTPKITEKEKSLPSGNETGDEKSKNLRPENDFSNEFSINSVYKYNNDNPIPRRVSMPEKLVYYIQLGVYSKKTDDTAFAGITPVCFDELQTKQIFKYYAGRFSSVNHASVALSSAKLHGFPDAFIVAFYNDEQIPVEKARQMEFSQIKF